MDDNRSYGRLLSGSLAARGYSCRMAGTAAEAMAALSQAAYDLFVLDVQLPDGDGRHLAEAICAAFPVQRSQIVFITALHRDDLDDRTRQSYVLYKPFGLVDLLRTLQEAADKQRQPRRDEPLRALVADDEPSGRKLLEALLTSLGARVDVADGGAAAVRMLEEGNYHLVVSDLQMPEVDGLEVLECARRRSPKATRVLVSGNPDALARAGTGEHPPDLLLAKPIDLARLRRLVEAVLFTRPDAALKEVRRRYAASLDAVFVKDIHGRYLYMNTVGVALLGRSPDEVIGRFDSEIFDEATLLEEVRGSDSEVLRTGRPYIYANTTRTAGDARTYLSVKFPVRDADELAAIGCLSRDVTEILGWSRTRRRCQIEGLVRDVRELMKLLASGAPVAAIDRSDVERCLQLPVLVPDRILVVERGDRALAGALRKAGYAVVEARKGKEAWELLLREGDGIDAIVGDMRELEGEFGDRVRARWPGIGILVGCAPGDFMRDLAEMLDSL